MCTLIEVQLKLNLKPEYLQRVKYKTLSYPFFLFFFFTQTLSKVFFPIQILHYSFVTRSPHPSMCNISQRELQYNTGTGENTP